MSLFPDSVQLETLLDEEPRLRALACALLEDPTAADEVVQETLERSSRQHVPGGSRLQSYLRRALESRVANRLRGERRRRRHELRAARPVVAPSTVEVVAQAEILRQLLEAVTGLHEPYRSTIWLRYYEDLPPRKIAERMDVPSNTVRTRVRTGLEKLRRDLDARHNGDRRAWTAVLMPWAMGGKQTATLTPGNHGANVMKRILVSAVAASFVVVGIWMGASLVLRGAPSPSGVRASVDGRPLVGDVELGVPRTPLPEASLPEAPPFSGRLFHHDGRPAVGVPYGTFPDGPDRPEWTRAPEWRTTFLLPPSPVEWYPSATTTHDGGWILPAGMTPPAVVSFEIERGRVASFEISPESRDLTLPEFVSVEVYLSGYTPGDRWSIRRIFVADGEAGWFVDQDFGHYVIDAGSCVLATSIFKENGLFFSQSESLSIPALRGQRMAIEFLSAGVVPQEPLTRWQVTAPEIVTFSVKERFPFVTVELLEWDQGPRAKLVVEADRSGGGQALSPDGVTQLRVSEPETDMRIGLRTEEGESFSTDFRMKEGETSQTISFIRGTGAMAEEILLPEDASMDSVTRLEGLSPSPATGDLEWTRRVHEFGTSGDRSVLEPTLYRTPQGLLVGDLPTEWTQMIVVMKDNRLARVLPGLPLRAAWFEPLEILLPEGASAGHVRIAVQYPRPGTSEPIWSELHPLSPGRRLPPAQRFLLSYIPERWTQILLLVQYEMGTLGRFARLLPESLPLRAQWLPDHALDPLGPIDLKALREAHAHDVSQGGFALTLAPWGSEPNTDFVLGFGFSSDTEEWPVWELQVPQGISYQLWLLDMGRASEDSWQKLPASHLR